MKVCHAGSTLKAEANRTGAASKAVARSPQAFAFQIQWRPRSIAAKLSAFEGKADIAFCGAHVC
jgi:hypothetical protein